MTRTRTPALGAEGWFIEDESGAALVGARCTRCGTIVFPPPPVAFCRNPDCAGTAFEPARLSSRGTVWAATAANYPPPPPFVAGADPFEPFAIAAVALDEGIVVMGQVVAGVTAEELPGGTSVELVVENLFEDAQHQYTVWKWKPVVDPR